MTTDHDNCRWCKWWRVTAQERGTIQSSRVECRRRPPCFPEYVDGKVIPQWPRTRPDDWCGDFERAVQS